MRRFTPIELAIGVALLGAIAAVAIPTFARELHASRLAEPIDGLAKIGIGAVAFAEQNGKLPDPAPSTPLLPPRGHKDVDPPNAWETPAWRALDFGFPEGTPHAYAFAFEPSGTTFLARARGDLDGDGILSTFEIRGGLGGEGAGHDPTKTWGPHVDPGTYVEAELE